MTFIAAMLTSFASLVTCIGFPATSSASSLRPSACTRRRCDNQRLFAARTLGRDFTLKPRTRPSPNAEEDEDDQARKGGEHQIEEVPGGRGRRARRSDVEEPEDRNQHDHHPDAAPAYVQLTVFYI